MREDELVHSDLFKMMKQYRRHDKWKFVPTQRAARLGRLVGGTVHTAKTLGLEARGKPLPRTIFTCTWRGKDQYDNLFCCNNNRIRHPRTKELLSTCGFHTKHCLGMHAGIPPKIEIPNKHAFSLKVYKQKFRADPPVYASVLELPGVVFLRPAKAAHPLKPEDESDSPAELSHSDTDSTDDDFPIFSAISKGFSSLARAVKRSRIGMAQRHAAATRIQALYRGAAARRAVATLRRAANVAARRQAGATIQAMFMRNLRRSQLKRRIRSAYDAAMVIQHAYRLFRYHRAAARDRQRATSARRIQHWVRARNMRRNFRLVMTRYRAQVNVVERAHAREEIGRVLRGYIARRRHKIKLLQVETENEAARVIQFFMHEKCAVDHPPEDGNPRITRSNSMARRVHINKVANTSTGKQAALALQSFMRFVVRKQEGSRLRKHMVRRAQDIQRVARGFLARKEARYRRRVIDSAWAWFAPRLPRGYYQNTLVFESYDDQFRDRLSAMRVAGTGTKRISKYDITALRASSENTWAADRDKMLAWLDRMERDFKQYDKRGTGRVTKQQFWRVVEGNGIRLKADAKQYLAEAFVDPGADKVAYVAYLRFGRGDPKLCAVHRVPVCPDCLYVGPCAASGCPEFQPDYSSTARGDPVLCMCGHHIAQHRPKLRQPTDDDAMPKSSEQGNRDMQSIVSAFAFQDAPEYPRPVTPPDKKAVRGVKLQATQAMTRIGQHTVAVETIEPHVFEVSKGKSLRQLQEQQRAMRSFLKFTVTQAMQPYVNANDAEFQEAQQHEYQLETRAKAARAAAAADKRHSLVMEHSATLASMHSQHQHIHLGDTQMSTVDPSGKFLRVTRTIKDDGRVKFDSGAAGLGLSPTKYTAALDDALTIPLASVKREAHFRRESACLANAETEKPELSPAAKASQIVQYLKTAKSVENTAMQQSRGTLQPGVAGAGKGARRLPHEGVQTVLPGGERSFRISRPVFSIKGEAIEQHTDAVLLYLTLLRSFMAPAIDGYDLVADHHRLVKFCFDNHGFLSQHWRKILKDVRTGTLDEHLLIDVKTRRELEADMQADPARAAVLEQVFDRLGYLRRTAKRAALARPAKYLGTESLKGDPGAAQRERRIAKRERNRTGPSSKLPELPEMTILGHEVGHTHEEAKLGFEDQVTHTLERAAGKHKVAAQRRQQAVVAATVKYAAAAEASKRIAVPMVEVRDEFGDSYTFGYEAGTRLPYIDLHPGSTSRFSTAAAAIANEKRHAGTHMRSVTATDTLLGPTWQAADVGEWPGQEVLAPERELPIETETRTLLQQYLKQRGMTEDDVRAVARQPAPRSHSQPAAASWLSPSSVSNAVPRSTPTFAHTHGVHESPRFNSNVQFATEYGGLSSARERWAESLLSDAGMRDTALTAKLSEAMQGKSGLWSTGPIGPLASAGAAMLSKAPPTARSPRTSRGRR